MSELTVQERFLTRMQQFSKEYAAKREAEMWEETYASLTPELEQIIRAKVDGQQAVYERLVMDTFHDGVRYGAFYGAIFVTALYGLCWIVLRWLTPSPRCTLPQQTRQA